MISTMTKNIQIRSDLKILFEHMVSLEETNYKDIFKKINKKYSREEAIECLERDHPNGQNIIYIYNSNQLIAYLRFIINGEKIRILALHLRKGKEHTLRKIMSQVYQKFSNLRFEKIDTDVHKVNNDSLLLHIRLGFQYRKMLKNKVSFTISKDSFLKRLEKYQ